MCILLQRNSNMYKEKSSTSLSFSFLLLQSMVPFVQSGLLLQVSAIGQLQSNRPNSTTSIYNIQIRSHQLLLWHVLIIHVQRIEYKLIAMVIKPLPKLYPTQFFILFLIFTNNVLFSLTVHLQFPTITFHFLYSLIYFEIHLNSFTYFSETFYCLLPCDVSIQLILFLLFLINHHDC